MKKSRPLDPGYLHECFDYDAEAGVLRWKARPRAHFSSDTGWERSTGTFAGTVAGSLDTEGYRRIRINRLPYQAHRIIWAMERYIDPGPFSIRHVNGDRDDNRIENLEYVG